ncbi:hypothetical protein K435DRAFT_651759, partial [Dendrothele bispora CBS 962.96]
MSNLFPPEPLDELLTNQILSSACDKMANENIEEAGCAVCGQLKPRKELSKLKSVKNHLHVLHAEGVTRKEHKKSSDPIKEFSGPVLDYRCSHICDSCRSSVRKGKVPDLALAKNLWLGEVPEVLSKLRFIERLLVAQVRHTCCFVKISTGQRKMKANALCFETPVPKMY